MRGKSYIHLLEGGWGLERHVLHASDALKYAKFICFSEDVPEIEVNVSLIFLCVNTIHLVVVYFYHCHATLSDARESLNFFHEVDL